MFENNDGAVQTLEAGIPTPNRQGVMEREFLPSNLGLEFLELLMEGLVAFGTELLEHQRVDCEKSFRDVPSYGRYAFTAKLHLRHELPPLFLRKPYCI
jgi:hypothetical protein